MSNYTVKKVTKITVGEREFESEEVAQIYANAMTDDYEAIKRWADAHTSSTDERVIAKRAEQLALFLAYMKAWQEGNVFDVEPVKKREANLVAKGRNESNV